MYFNVYFDPQVISAATRLGEAGLPLLISLWRAFHQNCFVVEFDEYLIQPDILREIDILPETSDRSTLKKLIKQIASENRFIYLLSFNDSGDYLTALTTSGKIDSVDLLVLPDKGTDLLEYGGYVEQLTTYSTSEFEEHRSSIAADGVTHAASALEAEVFLDRYLKRALANAQRIELIDKLLLLKYKQNFRFSLSLFFAWLEKSIEHPKECEIVIHTCFKEEESEIDELRADLQAFRRGRLSAMSLRLECYDGDHYENSLPHDRFILTDQVGIVVPRGLDLFAKGSERKAYIRDVTLNRQGKRAVEELLTFHARHRIEELALQIV